MLLPLLFIVWLVAHWIYCFDYFVKMIENEEHRTFTHFITFIGFMMWFIAILLVNKSMLDLFFEK